MKEVIVATKNKGKIREFENFFSQFGIQVRSLLDLPESLEIEETGTTFEENALMKARTIAERFNVDCIADDSGLEVDYLNGAPGVYSARYAGNHDDEANNDKLLQELTGVPIEERTARFVCAIAYVTSDLKEFVVRGTVEGYIGFERRGNHGFGYDPLFYVPSLGRTFAELSVDEKREISHRGNALKKLKLLLKGDSDEACHCRQ